MNSTYSLPKLFGRFLICGALLQLSVLGLIGFINFFFPGQAASAESRVLVTAAHLGEIDGYRLVYSDADSDYAVHVCVGYVADKVRTGDHVSLVGTTGVVDSVSDTEFTVSVKNISKITPGVSGSPIYLGKEPVGFISGWNGDGTLRCIFY